MNARFVISVVVALLSGAGGVLLVTKQGDPSQVLEEFERRMSAAFQRQLLFAPENPRNVAIQKIEVTAPDGRALVIELDRTLEVNSTNTENLEEVIRLFQPGMRPIEPTHALSGKLGKVTQTAPAWGEIQPMWSSLTPNNRRVATARAMLKLESKPNVLESWMWEKRSSFAAQPWEIEERGQLLTRRVGFATGGALAGFLMTFSVLTILLWAWRSPRSDVVFLRTQQAMKLKNSGSVAAKLVAAGMLCGALGLQQNDYYTVLRWVVCASSAFAAFRAAEVGKTGWVWLLAIVALAFNPVIPVHLKRETWAFIDPAVAVLLLISIAAIDRNATRQ